MAAGQLIGVDVGGTKIRAAGWRDGKLGEAHVVGTERSDPEVLIATIVDSIQAVREPDAIAVGMGLPSVVDFETGTIVSSVNIPLKDVPLRERLSERLGLPVFVDNDANAAAIAEAHDGDRLDVANVVMFTIGTGVGGGLVLNGKPYRGATGAAAEMGHTLIGIDLDGEVPQPWSLESAAAGRALDRMAAKTAQEQPDSALGRIAADGTRVTGRDAVELAKSGDPVSVGLLRRLGEFLGVGIANAINTFDPDVVAIGGGVSTAGELLIGPAREAAKRFTVPGVGRKTEIRLARHGTASGLIGAALLAGIALEDEAAG
jgi:glucokinase